jgi:hypothetical protein
MSITTKIRVFNDQGFDDPAVVTTVVVSPGEVIYAERFGRVKVQFHRDRQRQPSPPVGEIDAYAECVPSTSG